MKKDKGAGNKKSVLSGAIKDLNSEIKRLGDEKARIKGTLESVDQGIELDHKKQKELQDLMIRLVEKEADLKKKKKMLETQFENVSEKMGKMSRIKTEMSDL